FALAVALALGFAPVAKADVFTINRTDLGWYDSTGFHDAGNKNYITGNLPPGFHDYFVFNLSGVSGPIVSAQLRAFNPSNGYSGPAGGLTLNLFDVSTGIADLEASHFGRVDIYNDLGSGTNFGSQLVGPGSNGTFVTVDLNGAALAAL